MDPTEALRLMDDSVTERDWDTARDACEALISWHRGKGFRPTNAGDWRSGLSNARYADYLCYMLTQVIGQEFHGDTA